MVLNLYLIVNYYYNALFLFFLFIREVISLIFPVLNLYAWETIFISIASFSGRMLSVKHLFGILLSLFFFTIYHQSKPFYILFITIFTHCSHYNHSSRFPILDMCTLLHLLLYCSFPCFSVSITPFICFKVMEFLFQLEGGIYELWDCIHYDYYTLPYWLIKLNIH